MHLPLAQNFQPVVNTVDRLTLAAFLALGSVFFAAFLYLLYRWLAKGAQGGVSGFMRSVAMPLAVAAVMAGAAKDLFPQLINFGDSLVPSVGSAPAQIEAPVEAVGP